MRGYGLWIRIVLLCSAAFGSVLPQQSLAEDISYFPTTELPNAVNYLPAPPEPSSVLFADDFAMWMWGKSVRDTPRGVQASKESLFGMERMVTVFGDAMGMTISQTATPAIYNFMLHAGETANYAVRITKSKYQRQRPFARMNEHVAGEYDDEGALRENGSYPSAHTALGWGTALALAEMAPEQQDTILRRGFEYGQSRVIVGAHWQSDVEAGMLVASAAFARMHTSERYLADLAAARDEYRKKKGYASKPSSEIGYPDCRRVLDRAVDEASVRYYGDMANYWLMKGEQDTERGDQAVADDNYSHAALLDYFSPGIDATLSEEATPAIAALMKKVRSVMLDVSVEMMSTSSRKRPYVQLGEKSGLVQSDEDYISSTSYPSIHGTLGWGLALALAELAPARQDAILARGYEYGRSRIIVGYHFATDVQAGRFAASYAFGRLHNDEEFQELLGKAQKEYAKISGSPNSVRTATVSGEKSESVVYDLQGRRMEKVPSRGVYIQDSQKHVANDK